MIGILLFILIVLGVIALAFLITEHFWLQERINFETQYNEQLKQKLDDEIEYNEELTDELKTIVKRQLKIEDNLKKILEGKK